MPSLESLRFSQEEDGGAAGAMARADDVAREAPGRGTWACQEGCAFCCHLPVMVTESEARVIAPRVADWGRVERFSSGRCALLGDDDRCTVYDVRPLKCRAHTSTSKEACERHLRKGSGQIDIVMDGWLVKAVEAIRLGLNEPAQELHAALRAVRRGTAGP